MFLPTKRPAHALEDASDEEDERLIVSYRHELSQLQQALLRRHGVLPAAPAQAVAAPSAGPTGGLSKAARMVHLPASHLEEHGSEPAVSGHAGAAAPDDELHALVSSLLPHGHQGAQPQLYLPSESSPAAAKQTDGRQQLLQPSNSPLVTLLGPSRDCQIAVTAAQASTPMPGWRTNNRQGTADQQQRQQQQRQQQAQQQQQQQNQQQQQQQQEARPKSRSRNSLSQLLGAQPAAITPAASAAARTAGIASTSTTPAPAHAVSSTATKRHAGSVLYSAQRQQQQPASSKAKKARFSIKDAPTPIARPTGPGPGSSLRPADASSLKGLLGGMATPTPRAAEPTGQAATPVGLQGLQGRDGCAPDTVQQQRQQQRQPVQPLQQGQQLELQRGMEVARDEQHDGAAAGPSTENRHAAAAPPSIVPDATPGPSAALQRLLTPAPPLSTGDQTAQGAVPQDAPNPLHLMSQQRSLHRSFLAALPAQTDVSPVYALRGAGRGRAAGAGGGTLAARLAALTQRQKLQQERLVASGPVANAERLELTVVAKSWEANMVKCLCSCDAGRLQRARENPAAQQDLHEDNDSAEQVMGTAAAGPVQQHLEQRGQGQQQVFLFLQSKMAQQSVDVSVGCRVAVHAPWHEVVLPDTTVPVVLGHLLTNLH